MRVVTLLDTGSRLTVALRSSPYATGEMTLARSLIPSVPSDALLLLDRNFAAYELLWDLHHGRGAHFVVRIKRNMNARTVRRLGPGDRLVRIRFHPPLRRRRPELPRHWILREVTYCPKPGHEPIRVLTPLLDPTQVPPQEIATAEGLRWEHETALDETKTHLLDRTTANRPVSSRSETPSRVEQELYGIFVAHNLVRMLLHRAAAQAGKEPLHLSFTAALERIREAVRDMMAMATPRLPERYAPLLSNLARVVVPRRPGRSNRREVKIKMSSYPCKGTRHAPRPAA
jgi:hypothetical protein